MKISKIEVANSGPIKSFNEEIKPLTVIYGKNESGKTTIVEDITASLFKKATHRFSGACLVKIPEINNIEFSLDSPKKLDSLLQKDDSSLPKELFNLLYVKGAEVEISKDGITKTFLKNLISEQRVYKNIEKEIERKNEITNNSTKIENGKITGTLNSTLYRDYHNNNNKLKKLENLAENYINNDASIQLIENKKQKNELEKQKEQQEKAKRYKAFLLNKQINDIDDQNLEEKIDLVEQITQSINEVNNKKSQLKQTRHNLEQNQQVKQKLEYELNSLQKQNPSSNSDIIGKLESSLSLYSEIEAQIQSYAGHDLRKDRKWLENNKNIFKNNLKSNFKILNFLSISMLSLLLAFAFVMLPFKMFLPIKILSFASLIILQLIFVLLFFIKQKKEIDPLQANQIIKEIKQQYEKKFDEKLISIEDFDHKMADLDTIIPLWETLLTRENKVKTNFKKFFSDEIPKNQWHIKLKKLEDEHQTMAKKLYDKKVQKETAKNNLEKDQGAISDLESSINNLVKDINFSFKNLEITNIDQSEWEQKAFELKNEYQKLKANQSKWEGELAGLSVDKDNFISTYSGPNFSPSTYDSILDKLNKIETRINDYQNEIVDLKQKITSFVGIPVNTLDEESILQKIAEKKQEYKRISELKISQIIAFLSLKDVISHLQISEDKQIENYINSSDVSNLLFDITNKYRKIKFQEDNVLVIDDEENEFHLDNLSTGAQEQILLALRMGISKKLLEGKNSFLILDDAFQYSDWNKRNNLIKQVITFVKDYDWQVIYFTMDDNIKETFEKQAKKEIKNKFKLITI